jgi:hypothetical protein
LSSSARAKQKRQDSKAVEELISEQVEHDPIIDKHLFGDIGVHGIKVPLNAISCSKRSTAARQRQRLDLLTAGYI